MSAIAPGRAEVLRAAIAAQVAGVHTAQPAKVLSYSRASQTATVELGVSLAKRNPDGTTAPVKAQPISGVPVVFFGGSTSAITCDLEAGDTVLVVFCERSIDEWRSSGGAGQEPLDPRRHDLQDAVAIAGLRSGGAALPSDAYAAGALVIWDDTGDIRIGSSLATSPLVLGTPFLSALDTFLAALAAWVATAGGGGVETTALLAAITALRAGVTAGGYVTSKVKAL